MIVLRFVITDLVSLIVVDFLKVQILRTEIYDYITTFYPFDERY